MAKNLVIVESPAKAKTIHKILGSEYDVTSSMGHLRDLPRSTLGVDVENSFEPHYIVIYKRRKFAKELQKTARNRKAIFLAPDPDREGEAISWHLARLLRDDEEAEAKKAEAKRVKEAEKAAAAPAKKGAKKKKQTKAAARNGRKIYRIAFYEITPQAVKAAIEHPREIDLKKVNAQQARRILDRLVGYSLSPLQWKKIGRGLSAGRVQTVALRLIVDREKEIEAFTPQEYWTIEAELTKGKGEPSFKARLEKISGKKIGRGLSAGRVQSVTLRLIVDREKEIEAFTPQEYWTIEAELTKGKGEPSFKARLEKISGKKIDLKAKAESERIAGELRQQSFAVHGVEEKEQKRYPKPPFTTSTLQQEAFNKLGYSAARTMRIAHQLYEGMEIGEPDPAGLITYMRTDAVRVAGEALRAVRELIPQRFGQPFLPDAPRTYKAKKSAQEAHEAVRPTGVTRAPESLKSFLTKEQFALYQLIWQRFVASQMADAVDRVVSATIRAGTFQLKATGRTNIFAGWTQVYQDVEEHDEDTLPEGVLPPLVKDEALSLVDVVPSQHFTKPPRRYTDASLVKTLEENGIGRPSTYSPTIQTIVSRDYVRRNGGSFVPTDLGRIVTEMLIEHFPEVMDLKFTAEMEEELDRIEDEDLEWVSVVRHFYTPFSSRVAVAQEKMREVKREVIPTDHVCEKCGKPMVIKWGRFGQFLSCSAYPDCKNAKPVPTGVKCPEPNCGGDLVERKAKGRHFYGCSNYPTCRYTARKLPKEDDGSDKDAGSDEHAGDDKSRDDATKET